MTPPKTIIGQIVNLRFFERFAWRAGVFIPIIALFLLLTFIPERYKATGSLTPTDSASMGLSGALGQLGAIDNVFGTQAAVEVAVRIANSVDVSDRVIADVNLANRMKGRSRVALHRWLAGRVDIRSLRGGIIVVEMEHRDPALSRDIVASYIRATQQQLTVISRRQTNYKREILRKLVSDSLVDLADAQAKYDEFRLRNGFADPRKSIEAIGNRIPALEADIKGRQIALSAARQIYTGDNLVVKQQQAELAAVQSQLAAARATNRQGPDSLGKLVDNSNQLFLLERELGISRALYDSYMRFLQGTAVEDLTATGNVRVLEEAYTDTSRQYYLPAMVGALAFLLLWMAIEFYRLRPPVGERLNDRASHG
ncbi:MAG: hypothetical protein Q8L23_00600 [Caulobacter sp.]|nr:hypothetical protein [Caulobacter sp.]